MTWSLFVLLRHQFYFYFFPFLSVGPLVNGTQWAGPAAAFRCWGGLWQVPNTQQTIQVLNTNRANDVIQFSNSWFIFYFYLGHIWTIQVHCCPFITATYNFLSSLRLHAAWCASRLNMPAALWRPPMRVQVLPHLKILTGGLALDPLVSGPGSFSLQLGHCAKAFSDTT